MLATVSERSTVDRGAGMRVNQLTGLGDEGEGMTGLGMKETPSKFGTVELEHR